MLFSQPLLTVPLDRLLRLWGELVEAYHGVNHYGGNVAEIYSYRLQVYSPSYHGSYGVKPTEKEAEITYIIAANALAALVEEFCMEYSCQAMINDMTVEKWCSAVVARMVVYDYRAMVTINRR